MQSTEKTFNWDRRLYQQLVIVYHISDDLSVSMLRIFAMRIERVI